MGNQKAEPHVNWVLPYQQEASRCLTSTRLRAQQQQLSRARPQIAQMCALKTERLLRLLQRPLSQALARECLSRWFSLSSRSLRQRFSATVTRLAPAQALPRPQSRLKTMWPLQTTLPLQRLFQHRLPQSLFRNPKSSTLLRRCQTQVLCSRLPLRLRPTLNHSTDFASVMNGGRPSVPAIFMFGVLSC